MSCFFPGDAINSLSPAEKQIEAVCVTYYWNQTTVLLVKFKWSRNYSILTFDCLIKYIDILKCPVSFCIVVVVIGLLKHVKSFSDNIYWRWHFIESIDFSCLMDSIFFLKLEQLNWIRVGHFKLNRVRDRGWKNEWSKF